MKKTILLLILISPVFCFSQTATVIDHQPSSNISGNWRKYSLGQSFTIPGGYSYCCMNQLIVHMTNSNANNGFSAELRIYSGNGMTGTVVYGPETVTVNKGNNTFNLSTNLSITPGAQYTYELYFPGGAIGGIYAYVMNEHAAAIDTEPGGHSWNNRSANTATNVSNYDDLYEIYYLIPLPVTLTSFDANCNYDNVQLNWATESEINNDYFTIERSTDAINFEPVGVVNGRGNSSTLINYSWTDENSLNETAYYRLKQTDFDGRYECFQMEVANCQLDGEINLYPNPFNNYIELVFETPSKTEYTIEVKNYLGQAILNNTVAIGSIKIRLEIDSKLSKGVYFLQMLNSNEIRFTKKIIKL